MIAHMLAPDDNSDLRQMLDAQGAQRIPWLHGRFWSRPIKDGIAELQRVSDGVPNHVPAYMDFEDAFNDADNEGINLNIDEIESYWTWLEAARTANPRRPFALYGRQHQPFYWPNPGQPIGVWHGLVEAAASALSTSCYFRMGDLGGDFVRASTLLTFYEEEAGGRTRDLIVFVMPWWGRGGQTGQLVPLDHWKRHIDMIDNLDDHDLYLCWFGADAYWRKRNVQTRQLAPYVEALGVIG